MPSVNGFEVPQTPQPKPFFKADPLPGEKPEPEAVSVLKGDSYQAARNASRRQQEEHAQAESASAANKARPFARRAAVGKLEQTLLANKGIEKAYVPNRPTPAPTIRAGYTPAPAASYATAPTGEAADLAQKHETHGITSPSERVKEFSARYPTVSGKFKAQASKAHADLIASHLSSMPAGSALHNNIVKHQEHAIWTGAAKEQEAASFEKNRQAKIDARPSLQVATAQHVKNTFDTIAKQNPTMHPELVGEAVNHKLSEDLNLQYSKAHQAFPADTATHTDARKSLLLSRTSVRNAHRDMVSGHVKSLSDEVFEATKNGASHPRYESMVRAAATSKVSTESGGELKAPEGMPMRLKGQPAEGPVLGSRYTKAARPKGTTSMTPEKLAAKKEISPKRSAAVESFVKNPLSYHFGQGAGK